MTGGRRILALVTDAFGGYGGIAQYNRDILAAFSNCPDVGAIEVLPRLAQEIEQALPPRIRQHPAIRNKVRYAMNAAALTVAFRPHLIFSGHIYHGPLALWLARLVGAHLVSQVHGTEIWAKPARQHRNALERSDLVLAVSRHTRSKLLDAANVASEKAVVVNNTVGSHFAVAERAGARARFGISDQFAILTVARLDAREGYKGHDRLIPLVSRLRKKGQNVIYLIAGTGDDRPRLEELARSVGVEQQVWFLGRVRNEDLPDLYRAADLFALPSTGEGFGIAFLEIGTDKNHVHFLIQSSPTYSPTKIVTIVKSLTAREILKDCPEVKKKLWGGEFWSDGYFVSTVGQYSNENAIARYIKNQGQTEEYAQILKQTVLFE
jgi:phosphatidylinositol alpha-1,6-mannosyltransferase